jgi:hypothetical protein
MSAGVPVSKISEAMTVIQYAPHLSVKLSTARWRFVGGRQSLSPRVE